MANNPKASENLNKGGTKGNKGGGRKPDEFKKWCQKLCQSPKARKFIKAMIEGDAVEEKVIDTVGGEPTKLLVSAPASARIKALEFVAGYGYGKPSQTIDAGEGFEKVLEAIRGKYA